MTTTIHAPYVKYGFHMHVALYLNAVVVNLLEQLQRRSDLSLRRRKTGAEKFGVSGTEAGFI
jgi:hypothetical protein